MKCMPKVAHTKISLARSIRCCPKPFPDQPAVLRHIFAKIEIHPIIDSLATFRGPVQVDWNLTK
jgi:hypothetical protein